MMREVPLRRRSITAAELGTGGVELQASPTRVELIRAAARRHFAERGFDGASMREIAADAGITIATLYFHCATKEQLLFDVLEGALARLSRAVQDAVDAAGESASERLAAAVAVHIDYCARRDYGATISTSELRGLTGELRERHVTTRDRYEAILRELVESGIAAGEFAPVDVNVIVAGILGIGFSLSRWYRPAGRLSLPQIAAEYSRFILNGLRPAGAGYRTGGIPTLE
jgi:TetR/AcrR family transcriptional regulator, cholesterol catabolism regulator